MSARSSAPFTTPVIRCHRCHSEASVRAGKHYLCVTCALAGDPRSGDDALVVVCDLCDRESVARVGERFLCARCALAILHLGPADAVALEARSLEAMESFLRGEEEPTLSHGVEVARLVREGTVRLVDAAAVHHEALARSIERSREPRESIRRVEAAAVLFDVWATSFDAGRERLERENEVLAHLSEGLERQVDDLERERDEIRGRLRRAEADRRHVLRRVVDAKERERRRISLGVHDDAVQVMAAALMRLGGIRRREREKERREELKALEASMRLCIARLRRLMFELRADLLEQRGLAEALRHLLQRTMEDSHLDTDLHNALIHEPDPIARTSIYRIVQEAVANARRHARASRVDVTLEELEGGIHAIIGDDGVGFLPESALPSAEHLGLGSMRERAEASGGWLRVESTPGLGTTVRCWIPTASVEAVIAS